NNGTCYRQCQGRSVLLSSATAPSLPLSSSLGWRGGAGAQAGLSHCLWVLSMSEDLSTCPVDQPCPTVALTLHPDSYTQLGVALTLHPDSYTQCPVSTQPFPPTCSPQAGCGANATPRLLHTVPRELGVALTLHPDSYTQCPSSYVYVFDGLPRFLGNGVVHSDHNLIGAFCGTTRTQPITVEATSGVISVYFEANVSSGLPQGFNASFWVRRCQEGAAESEGEACQGRAECLEGLCQCPEGFGGPHCDRPLCPGECSAKEGRGSCDLVRWEQSLVSLCNAVMVSVAALGVCVCSEGWAGSDCSSAAGSGSLVWQTLLDTQLTVNQAHRFLHRLGHSLVSGPQGTLWMYGGLSLSEGILGNVYRRWTQMLTSSVDEASAPTPRYHHASALLTNHDPHSGPQGASHNIMLVVGGVTQKGVAMDTWSLNLSSLVWKEYNSSLLPPVAGHTLTVRRDSTVLLIGGYSPENGFNHLLLEFNLDSGNWTIAPHTGTPPTASCACAGRDFWEGAMASRQSRCLYGHSAVYHDQTDAVYVFGGYRFHVETVEPSGELYSLYYPNLTWSLLVPSQGNKVPTQGPESPNGAPMLLIPLANGPCRCLSRSPLSRFFHAAALLRDTMVIVGGRTGEEDYSNTVSLYQINCNTWIQPGDSSTPAVSSPSQPGTCDILSFSHLTFSAVGEPVNRSVSLAMAGWGGRLFLSGGFNGVTLGRLLTLTLPPDPCTLLPSPEACNATSGSCVWCRGSCTSSDTAERLGCAVSLSPCSPTPRLADQCRRLKTCSECLARHPKTLSNPSQVLRLSLITLHPNTKSQDTPRSGHTAYLVPVQFCSSPKSHYPSSVLLCKWCTNCPEGACINSSVSCTSEHDCRINQREIFLSSNCTETSCEASDCPKCTASGKCMWTRQFKRTGETRRILSVNPTYDWTCFSYALLNVSPMQVESSPPLPCPPPCHHLATCSLCLGSRGSDGGWQHCVWSVALQQCMSPSFVPLRCEAGQCGRLLSGGDSCSPYCSQLSQCSQCIARPQCGWCATRGGNGAGRCLQGGLDGVSEGVCPLWNSSWSFLNCPEEDECANGHHHCNSTQDCHDLPQGYHCTCRQGYVLSSTSGQCEPVCAQGCVNGTCVSPGVCQCHFGFVGDNCSSQCRCNKHSNCAGVTQPDVCLECHNNTMGLHCEKCKSLFVGSAVGGGTCRPCREFCRGNSVVCLSREEYKRAQDHPEDYPLDPDHIVQWVAEGPPEDNAVCVSCQNNSVGDKCESCLSGYFLLQEKCEKCQCNGHADTCNEHDGTGCPCQNNTETSSCLNSQSDRKDCYRQQCAKCKDAFNGTPINGRQCYRQFNVDQEYCFDPTSQTNCFHEPNIRNLLRGRTVFFAAQPKFTNVDIRVTIDVTFGEVEVYVSNSHDTFIVDVDRQTGVHTVRIEDEGGAKDSGPPPPSPIKVFANSSSSLSPPLHSPLQLQSKPAGGERELREERAEGLISYITVWKPQTVLVVRGVRDRVVITFPHEVHSLKSSRFYIALLGVGTDTHEGQSQGLLFLRQDQAHIDLFVFFSVFFSCFFLFLSVCVLLWKVKQFLDFRREQRRHIQEMTKMASRPFAKLTVYLEPEEPQLIYLHSSGGGVGGSTVSLSHARPGKLGGVMVGSRGRLGATSYKHDPGSGPAIHHHHLALGGGNGGQHLPIHYLNAHHYAPTAVTNPAPHHHHHHPSSHSGYQHFCRSDPFLSQLMGFSYSSFKVGPITLEPTDDGMAGVATVLIQLPGGILAPNRACLGSALVTLRQNLQEYCGHGSAGAHLGAGGGRKGLLGHQHLTTMAITEGREEERNVKRKGPEKQRRREATALGVSTGLTPVLEGCSVCSLTPVLEGHSVCRAAVSAGLAPVLEGRSVCRAFVSAGLTPVLEGRSVCRFNSRRAGFCDHLRRSPVRCL
ncbi:hypothetical protein JZ751_014459, partial [Albula glossodonta]